MDEKKEKHIDSNITSLKYKDEFETVYDIISAHKKRAMRVVHNESIGMLWEVGAYASDRLKRSVWGDGVVRMLAEYIHTKSPKAKGWSYRTIYKMVQFYETYSSDNFGHLVEQYGVQRYLSEVSPKGTFDIVPFEMAQIPSVLFATGWTNHQIIMNRCKSDVERLFIYSMQVENAWKTRNLPV